MKTSAFIGVRVSPEMKNLVRRLAEREQITESALVKQLLETVLRATALQELPRIERAEGAHRDARLYVRLDPDDRALLTSRAAARGMRPATYVSVLVRSHLRALPPIPKAELLALKESIAELRAIGVNLNQIARQMNRGAVAVPEQALFMAMLKVAEGLRDHFKALLIANTKSWEQGHAE